jgi:hypothetical protein
VCWGQRLKIACDISSLKLKIINAEIEISKSTDVRAVTSLEAKLKLEKDELQFMRDQELLVMQAQQIERQNYLNHHNQGAK